MKYREIITHKYREFPAHTTLVFDAICKTLSARMEEVDWTQFDEDDWQLLNVMAKTEGVAPLLYDAFKRSNPKCLNVQTFNKLQQEYYATAAYNALLFRELDRILTALDEADIRVILLKGAALAQTLYDDPALRPMSDLDLLVPFEKLDRAVQVANDLGFQSDDFVPYWPGIRRVRAHHEHVQNRKGVNLELHWSLTQAMNDDHTLTDWFWEHTQLLSSNLGFSEAQTLSYTSHLMYLTAHFFLGHGAAGGLLLWLNDLRLLLDNQRDEIDWDTILVQSRRLKWKAPLVAGLSQLQDTFEMEFPPGILESLKSHQDARSQRWVNYKSQPNRSKAWRHWQRWRNLTWRGKLVYSLGDFFPSPVYLRSHYDPKPAWSWPLYYFYRWGDIAAEAVKYVFG